MSKPQGGIGAWALDAELAEAEERERAAIAAIDVQPAQSFPSLKEATTTKPKKKKPVPIPLSQFVAPAATLTRDEMRRLPTAPEERSPDDLNYARGFHSYTGSLRGSGDDHQHHGPPSPNFDQPSRADEANNWAGGKRSSFTPRNAPLSSGVPSRADELDNWSDDKKLGDIRGPLQHNTERRRLVLDPPKRRDAGAPSVPAATTRPSPFGAAQPREEVLKEKGLDPGLIDSEIEAKKTSRPTSSHSSRPSSAQSIGPRSPSLQAGASEGEGAQKARVKVNPFGDAKPREVRLQEQGIDWRKLDLELEHRSVDRQETEEEKLLKEEINRLNALLKEIEENSNTGLAKYSAEDLASLRKQILHKEADLDLLMRQLDDKVRFSQRFSSDNRPGSGAGRLGISSDRPPSQSGRSEESINGEFIDRTRSRGRSIGDGWSKPVDDRRGFQGGRERGFRSDRNMDRSSSRVGW